MGRHPARINRWVGKALGAAAALIFAPAAAVPLLWWVVAGIIVGHLLDLAAVSSRAARRGNSKPATPSVIGPASIRFAFAGLGRIAEASGAFGAEHLRASERLMDRLALSAERRQEAMVWLHAGRDGTFPFDTLAPSCRTELAAHPVLRELTLDNLCRMCALADSAAATTRLLELGHALGCDREALAQRAVMMAALLPTRPALQQACDTLGVRPGDDPETIRLAYRRRVSRWHPDRLPRDADGEQRALAERRMWQLREALDTLLTGQADDPWQRRTRDAA